MDVVCHVISSYNQVQLLLFSAAMCSATKLSRFLVAAPCTLAGTRLYRETDASIEAAIDVYSERLFSLLERTPDTSDGRNTLKPRQLRLDAGAIDVWRRFFDGVERRCLGDLRNIIDVASKSAEQAARIAAVMTIVADASAIEFDVAAMSNAVSLMEWYLGEALRLAEGRRSDPRLQRAARMLEWLQKQMSPDVTFRKMMHSGPGSLRTKKLADDCVSVLVDHGWLVEVPGASRRYRVRPASA